MIERGNLTVTEPARDVCGATPERGCGLQAVNDDVVALVVVTDTTADQYTVSVRFAEYVGPAQT